MIRRAPLRRAHGKIAVKARFTGLTLVVGAALVAGCAAPQPRQAKAPDGAPPNNSRSTAPTVPEPVSAPVASPPAPAIAGADLPQNDPMAYLRRVHNACTKLEQYHLVFIRRERRGIGLLKSLHDPERIECWYRRTPFSTRLKWLDPDIKYGESTYVRGQDDDRLRFTPRPKLFNLPYRLYRVSPQTPVNWGECRYPVTEFGVEILMKRTLDTIAAFVDGTRVTFVGVDTVPGSTRVAYRIRVDYPRKQNPAPVQELFVDPQTDLPLHT